MDEAAPNEYEAARLRRIADNRRQLELLGIANGAARLGGAPAAAAADGWVAPSGDEAAPQPPRNQRRRAPVTPAQDVAPTRVSRRKRGEAADGADGGAFATVAERAEARAAAADGADDAPPGPRARVPFPEPLPQLTVVAPFTLRAIGVTVWELGAVQRDSFAPRFWSSKGCLFHHAYPVGFRASKTHFGRPYTMRIVAGATGPRFRVTDDGSGASYEGSSPTKPWTAVCLALRLGTRISGPLFFGFSDAVTMRALAALYTPEELAAARAGGGTVASRAPSAEERAADEFRAVDGLGDATALALAHTRALAPGGGRIASLAALAALARADGGEALTHYLLHSPEVGEATRRWPLWRIAVVPRIIAALLSDDPAAARADKENRAAQRQAGKRRRDAPPQLEAQDGNAAGEPAATPPQAPVKPRPAKHAAAAGAHTPSVAEAPPPPPAPPTITRSGRSARRKHDADWVWGAAW